MSAPRDCLTNPPEPIPEYRGPSRCFACANEIPDGHLGVLWIGRPYHRDCYPHAAATVVRVNPRAVTA